MMPSKDASGAVTGYVIACGTGIEGCADQPAECASDPRINWRTLVVGTDLNGKRIWSRMDNF